MMVKNEQECEELNSITQLISTLSPLFKDGNDLYFLVLEKKDIWKKLEKKRLEYQYHNKNKELIKKITEWEQIAKKQYSILEDKMIDIVKKISNSLSTSEIKTIEKFIISNSLFKDVIKKKNISINDEEDIINFRFIYIIYMMKIGRAISLKKWNKSTTDK